MGSTRAHPILSLLFFYVLQKTGIWWWKVCRCPDFTIPVSVFVLLQHRPTAGCLVVGLVLHGKMPVSKLEIFWFLVNFLLSLERQIVAKGCVPMSPGLLIRWKSDKRIGISNAKAELTFTITCVPFSSIQEFQSKEIVIAVSNLISSVGCTFCLRIPEPGTTHAHAIVSLNGWIWAGWLLAHG